MSRRLRIFAGPNGSGKTTLYRLTEGKCKLGILVNADDIESCLRQKGYLSFDDYQLKIKESQFIEQFQNSPLFELSGKQDFLQRISIKDNRIILDDSTLLNSYFASFVAEYIRMALISAGKSMSFETVMSDTRKIDFIHHAQQNGYRIYLYFITTIDPTINIERVRKRVKMGGHGVPEEKIVSRYTRSLENLLEALRLSNRAFLFDNSSDVHEWIAEVEDGNIQLHTDQIPRWFKEYILDKLN